MITSGIKAENGKKLENAIFISVILFIYKIIFPVNENYFYLIINESIIFISVFAWGRYVAEFINPKLSKPLSLVVNTGILNALIFFIISISSWLFTESQNSVTNSNIIYVLFSTIIVFVFIGSLAYIFSVYKSLCFHRQKKNPSLYFNTMIVFFLLTAFLASFLQINPLVKDYGLKINLNSSHDYIYSAFYGITIILIFVNSLRVAWIAFLNKKQKLTLLGMSIILSILSLINFTTLKSEDFVIIRKFSPALEQLLSLVMIYGAIYFTIIFFITLFHLPTAEAIDQKSQELTSVKDLSKLMNQVFDFEELSDTITSTTLKVSNSDVAWLVITNKDKISLHSIINLAIIDTNNISEFLIKNNLLSKSEVSVIDLTVFDKKYRLPQNIKFIVSAPLSIHNEVKGFLFAGRKTSRDFDEEDSKSVGTFAGFAAVALENAKLLEESIVKERLEKELDVAREVQYKILPQKNPNSEKFEASSLFVPAFEVGGDYYDFFEISNSKLGVVIADVSGKGIEAAFIMAEIKGIFSTLSKLYSNPKELLIKANSILQDSISRKSFVTAIYGIIDIEKETFRFARAGHSPLIYYNGTKVQRIIPTGIGLGLDYSGKFENTLKEMEIKLNNNDIITLFTDGINESLNKNNEEYGFERLEDVIVKNSDKGVEDLSNEIMKSVSLFAQNNSQHDDITLVLFKWNSHINLKGDS